MRETKKDPSESSLGLKVSGAWNWTWLLIVKLCNGESWSRKGARSRDQVKGKAPRGCGAWVMRRRVTAAPTVRAAVVAGDKDGQTSVTCESSGLPLLPSVQSRLATTQKLPHTRLKWLTLQEADTFAAEFPASGSLSWEGQMQGKQQSSNVCARQWRPQRFSIRRATR